MKEETAAKVKITRDQIENSILQDDSKELLYVLLDTAAQSANGAPDKLNAIGDTLLAFCLYEIKSAVRFPVQLNQAVSSAVKEHSDTCPMRTVNSNMPKMLIWLMPYKWPLCVVTCVLLFAPNAAAIIGALAKVFKPV